MVWPGRHEIEIFHKFHIMNTLVVNLQIYGTRPGCAILSITAVPMDINSGVIGEAFFCPINLDKSVEAGFHIEREAVNWWKEQDGEFYRVNHSGVLGPYEALEAFNAWINHVFDGQPFTVYGNSMHLDFSILHEACKRLRLPYPFDYSWERDFSTLVHIAEWSRKIRNSIPTSNLKDHPADECIWLARVIYHIHAYANNLLPARSD